MMKNLQVLGIVLIVILATVVPASAQSADCDAPPLLEALGAAVEALQSGSGIDDALTDLRAALGTYQAVCSGLVFTGNGDWVSDPLTVPDGFYRARFSADGVGGTATLTELDGDCDLSPLLLSLNGSEGAEAVELRECFALLEVKARGGWSLTFELLAP